MELAFEQKRFPCLRRTAHLSAAQEQTQELIIPDSLPDAARTLICYAEPELQSKTSRAGALLVSGTLRASCLYADEQNGMQLLSSELPFTVKLENAGWQEQTLSQVRCTVRSADSRLINSRKVLLRVSVLAQADGYEPSEQTLRVLTDAPACVQQKTAVYTNHVPVELAEQSFQLSDELPVPEGRAPIARVVSCAVQPLVQEQSFVGDKAVFKGSISLLFSYLDEEQMLRTMSLSLPFSQYCQMQQEHEQPQTPQTLLCVTGVQLEVVPAEQGQKLLLGVGLLAQCTAMAEQELCVCEDAYTTRGALNAQWQEQAYNMRLDGQTLRVPLRQSFPAQAGAVLDCRVYPDAQAIERAQGEVVVHVPLRADVVYTDADGAPQMQSFHTELSCRSALCENGSCEAQVQLQPEGYAAAGSGTVELRYDAVVHLQCFARQTLKSLCGGTLELTKPREPRPTVVLRRASAQQELWSLAKQYQTTVQAIASANQLTQPVVEAGQLLLIPM